MLSFESFGLRRPDDLSNKLPVPLGRMVPRATEALAEAMVATSRIEAFLNLAEDSASRSRLTDQIKSAIWIELWEILGCN